MTKQQALGQIKTLLGPDGVVQDAAEKQKYLQSWRNNWEGKTPFVALPSSTEQVSAILKICHENHIPVVPQGGNTGLVGGCIPSAEGDQLVLCLARLNKIRSLDQIGATLTVDAGMTLKAVRDEADHAGFLFPLSMAPEATLQIGGAISTNAGGVAVLRYGSMRELVLGLEVALPDGTILSGLKSLTKDNAGYNLAHLFIGSEGTLGIVTAATLKLFPKLNQTVTGMVTLNDPEAAMTLLARFRAECGEHLSALEILSQNTMGMVRKHFPDLPFPFATEAPYYLLIELSSSSKSIPLHSLFKDTAAQALKAGEARDVFIADDATQAHQLWALRKSSAEALREEGRTLHFDISVPLAALAHFLQTMEDRIQAIVPGMLLAPFGHIGDGNIHYNMQLPEMDGPARIEAKKQVQALVYGEVTNLGGSISAEHGIGTERKKEFAHFKQPEAIRLMKAIKQAIDPTGLMNPGKIFDRPINE